MIDYYGPYKAKLGGARYLGQDAVIVPVAPPPATAPGLLPQGPQAPAPEPPPGVGLVPVAKASLFGSKVPIAPVVVASVLTVGLIAAIGATTRAWSKGKR